MRRLTDGDSDTGQHFATYFGNLLGLKLRMRVRSVQLIEDIQQETREATAVIPAGKLQEFKANPDFFARSQVAHPRSARSLRP